MHFVRFMSQFPSLSRFSLSLWTPNCTFFYFFTCLYLCLSWLFNYSIRLLSTNSHILIPTLWNKNTHKHKQICITYVWLFPYPHSQRMPPKRQRRPSTKSDSESIAKVSFLIVYWVFLRSLRKLGKFSQRVMVFSYKVEQFITDFILAKKR